MSALVSTGQLRASLLRWALVLIPGIVLLVFLSSTLARSIGGSAWIAALEMPSIMPSRFVAGFCGVATCVLMGLALALVVTARGAPGRVIAIKAFAATLLLLLAWPLLIWGAHRIAMALGLILVLDLALMVTILLFARVRPVAAALLAPCLAWTLFVTLLNWQLLQANPAADGNDASGAVSSVEFK